MNTILPHPHLCTIVDKACKENIVLLLSDFDAIAREASRGNPDRKIRSWIDHLHPLLYLEKVRRGRGRSLTKHMSDADRIAGPSVQLPGPDDDATPFMLRCYVKAYPFRPLQDFEMLPKQDEFKVYVWRSASLRDIANMLHMRDPSLSTPISSHSFRIVRLDPRRDTYTARSAGKGVTRIAKGIFEEILNDVISQDDSPQMENDDAGVSASTLAFDKIVSRLRPRLPDEADEEAATITLDELDFMEGDVLDCVIKGSPALSSGTTIKRSRIDSADSYRYSQGRDGDRDRSRYEGRAFANDRRHRYR